MTSTTFFFLFIPLLAIILLAVNLILAPHMPYSEKNSAFECGFHSFLGQTRAQFSVSFFVFAILFLIFDLEILLIYPYAVSAYANDLLGLVIMLIFFILLTVGFAFELGKNALEIDSRQKKSIIKQISSYFFTNVSGFNGGLLAVRFFSTTSSRDMDNNTKASDNENNSKTSQNENLNKESTGKESSEKENSDQESSEKENSDQESSEKENSDPENASSTSDPANHPREDINEEDQAYYDEGAEAMMEEPVDNIPNSYLRSYIQDTKEVIQNPSVIGIHTPREVDKDRALITAWQTRNAELRAEENRRIDAGELPADTVRSTTPNFPFAVSPESSAPGSPVAGPSSTSVSASTEVPVSTSTTTSVPASTSTAGAAPITVTVPGPAPAVSTGPAEKTLGTPVSEAGGGNSPVSLPRGGNSPDSLPRGGNSPDSVAPAAEGSSLESQYAFDEDIYDVSSEESSSEESDKSDSQSNGEKNQDNSSSSNKRKRDDDENESDNKPSSSAKRKRDDDDDDEDNKPSSSAKRKRDDDDDDKPSSSTKRKRDDDEDDKPFSSSNKRKRDDDDLSDNGPSSKKVKQESETSKTDNNSSGDNTQIQTQSDKNPDKQSPIDYVIEKQQCEMPEIPDSDGGE